MSTENEEVLKRLETLIGLVALGVCAGRPQKEQVRILSGAGLTPKAIAALLDTTPNTVSVTLSALKREKEKKKPTAKATKVQPTETDETESTT